MWSEFGGTGYWGKDDCVCGDQICEVVQGEALRITPEPDKSMCSILTLGDLNCLAMGLSIDSPSDLLDLENK